MVVYYEIGMFWKVWLICGDDVVNGKWVWWVDDSVFYDVLGKLSLYVLIFEFMLLV